jgi:hypothetical protein
VRRLLALLLVVLAGIAALTAYLFVLAQSDDPKRADVIVVLSGDRARLATGLRLFHDSVAPTLAISRDGRVWPAADALCTRPHILCFRANPYSTEGEAQSIERLGRGRDWRTIVVVTSRYHLRRARMLFERCMDRSPEVVAARTTFLDYVQVVPWEWGKFVYQLTVDRSC